VTPEMVRALTLAVASPWCEATPLKVRTCGATRVIEIAVAYGLPGTDTITVRFREDRDSRGRAGSSQGKRSPETDPAGW